MTVLMVLSMIAMDQTKSIDMMMDHCTPLLDYPAYHADAKIHFYSSDMIINIHSDASYLSDGQACSPICGHFFMGWLPNDGEQIRINGEFHVSTNAIHFFVVFAAEAELGALFHNCHMGIILCSILKDMGHSQPKTPVHCDNTMAIGIANSTVKLQHSHLM